MKSSDEKIVEKIVGPIPSTRKKKDFNTFDRIWWEGFKEGYEKSIKKGYAQEVATRLLAQSPDLKDDMIAYISDLDIKKVKALRKKLASKKP